MRSYIIGYPLNKPRSVPLWRKFFKKKKMKVNMQPLEVKPNDLKKIILSLKKNKSFLASAVTMPFKKDIVNYSKYGDKITQKCRSANLIIKNKNNLLCFNTDIQAAINSIPKKKYSNIMLYGLGGVGEPLFNILYLKYKFANFYLITKKTKSSLKGKRIFVSKKINYKLFPKIDLFINCSPLGSNLKKNFIVKSPIKFDILKENKNNVFVFDIVYKPKNTVLSRFCRKLKIKYKNGIEMNTNQAHIALKKISKFYERNKSF